MVSHSPITVVVPLLKGDHYHYQSLGPLISLNRVQMIHFGKMFFEFLSILDFCFSDAVRTFVKSRISYIIFKPYNNCWALTIRQLCYFSGRTYCAVFWPSMVDFYHKDSATLLYLYKPISAWTLFKCYLPEIFAVGFVSSFHDKNTFRIHWSVKTAVTCILSIFFKSSKSIT